MTSVLERSYTQLALTLDDRILRLTPNRPEQLNAFTPTMSAELADLFTAVNGDPEVAAVVVTGAGRAYCAGMDLSADGNVFGLNESLRPTRADVEERFDDPEIVDGVRDTGGRVTLAIHRCLKPVIGAINGPAVGIGATMTLAMDARLASESARIGFVFGRLGIVAEACSTWFLPRLVGIPAALDLLYSADVLDAFAALERGLVQAVHSPDSLLDSALELAHRWTDSRSAFGTAAMRQMVYRHVGASDPLVAHIGESLAMFYASIGDGKEGVAAFLEKRSPSFANGSLDRIVELFG
jgi:enoyl-CoA hydratase/carnithine racemase